MFRILVLLSAAVVVVSCITTPAIYHYINYLFPGIRWPYSRVFDRVVLVVAIVLVVTFRKKLRFSLVEVRALKPSRLLDKALGVGLLMAATSATAALVASLAFHRLQWSMDPAGVLLKIFLKGAATALVVSIIEEIFFRAIVYRRTSIVRGHWFAAIASSSLYAVLHFMSPEKGYQPPQWSFLSGFDYASVVLSHYFRDGVLVGMIGLFLVGMVLCEAVRRTGSLALSIGLHAGWILALKLSLVLTNSSPGTVLQAGLGGRYFFLGEPATWVCVLCVWIAVRLRYPLKELHDPENSPHS